MATATPWPATPSGAATTPACPPSRREPGYGVRPEWDHDLAWHHALRLPVIAAVNGACAGIGLALALFCDLRFVSATAKLTTAAPKLGLPAEYGTSWMLPRLVGVTRAADLLLSGRVVTGAETEAWGLWNGVAADGAGALAAATAAARQLATEVSPASVAATKRQLYGDLLRSDVGAAVEDSKRLMDRMMAGADYREGVASPPRAPPADLLTLRRRSPLRERPLRASACSRVRSPAWPDAPGPAPPRRSVTRARLQVRSGPAQFELRGPSHPARGSSPCRRRRRSR